MKRISTLFSLILLGLILAGCSTPWAPVPEGERKNRLKFYETDHWPYSQELPPIKVPAQVASGLPSLPAIIVMTPFTLFLSDEPTYDFGMAVLEAERLYMEYPGYAIYRTVGYPMYMVKTGAFYAGESICSVFSSEEEEEAENLEGEASDEKDVENNDKPAEPEKPEKPVSPEATEIAQKDEDVKTDSSEESTTSTDEPSGKTSE